MKHKKFPQFVRHVETLKGEAAYSVLEKAENLEKKGKDIIHLEIGQPDFETPRIIRDSAIRALKDGKTKYTPTLGIGELRSALARDVVKRRNVRITEKNIAVVPSAKMGLYLAMVAILKPGDEVICPNPSFPAYENVPHLLGCTVRPVPLLENNNFSFDLDVFTKLVNKKTKLIILNSPSNPTGGVIPEGDLRYVSSIAKKHNIWVLTDEIYTQLVYGKKCPSIYSLPGMKERTILVDGFSKTYAMAGWRLGYMVLPERLMSEMENVMVNTHACTSTFTQYAALSAFTPEAKRAVLKMRKEYKKRRDYIVRELNKIEGIRCQKPQGAFYVFPNITGLKVGSEKLADYLLEKAGVALLPGTAFGKYGEGYLRISYASSMENLQEAAKRIGQAIKKL